MLQYLSIKNLAIVDHVEVEFEDGFNVISGETGAGKSVIIGAVQLILGERADKSCIRTGTDRCEISAVFSFDDLAPVLTRLRAILETLGIEMEDNELIVRRVITPASSRCLINSTPVPLSTVKQISSLLVAVHGPTDNHGLVKAGVQKELLDLFGNSVNAIDKCRNQFALLQQVDQEIAEVYREIPNQQQLMVLKDQLIEITELEPAVGEDDELKEKHEISANSNRIMEIISGVRDFLSEQENCLIDQLSSTSRSLMELERLDSNNGEALRSELFNIIDQLQDFSVKLNDYADKVDIDPNEFARMEDRMRELSVLKRKFGPTLEDVIEFAKAANHKIDLFENSAEKIAELKEKRQAVAQDLETAAQNLSNVRKEAGERLSKQVAAKLRVLGFKNSEFGVALERGELRADGFDIIDFKFSPNVGEPLQSLRKIASSGEISRVMLALKTVLAAADHTSLLVFDEIDANVGGKVANMVGAELAALGGSHQVLCISHLPQVAASGDVHFVVEKQVVDDRTRALIERIEGDTRVMEIARMLGGDHSNPEVIEHARVMISKK